MNRLSFIFLFLTSLLINTTSFAAVNIHHYMNAIAGEYKLVFEGSSVVCADFVHFSIDNKGKLKMIEDECGMMNAQSSINFATSEFGPISLPTTQILLTYGSDEEQSGWSLGLTVNKTDKDPSEVMCTGLLFLVNDGPNLNASVARVTGFRIMKLNKETKNYDELQKI
jgi:hypothetical protein